MNSKNLNLSKLENLNKIYSKINKSLKEKYLSIKYSYNNINTNYLIFNEKCSIVSKFKDFLIFDDSTEFFRRYYNQEESIIRLKKILLFYETYSKLFPNYLSLPESSYLYKNIRRKQKMIDAVNEIKKEEEENRRLIVIKKNSNINENNIEVFTTEINEDIQNYNPSLTRELEDNSFLNNVSVSIYSKKINENSFLNEYKNDILINESNNSIEKILNIMNESRIYTKDLKERILIEENIKKKNQIKRENQYLISPKKSKKFISKINNNDNNFNLNSKHSIEPINLNKVISTLTSTSKNKKNYIINNYQNIIIPKGNTIININNNYFQYNSNSNNHQKNINLKPTSPNLKKKYQKIFSNKKKTTSPITTTHKKIYSQIKIIDTNKKKQCLLSPSSLLKKNKNIFKSPSKTNMKTPKNQNKFSSRLNSAVKQYHSYKKISIPNNNNLYGIIFPKKKIEQEKNKHEKNYYSNLNIKINTLYKNKILRGKRIKNNILYSPKNLNSINKTPITELKKKYKNYINKNKSTFISKRNSCNNFLSETKSKKNLKEKYGYSFKKNNYSSNKSSISQLIKNDSSLTFQKSIKISPKNDSSNSKTNNDSTNFTPITIKVNRKNYLTKVKKNQINSSKNGKSINSSKKSINI